MIAVAARPHAVLEREKSPQNGVIEEREVQATVQADKCNCECKSEL